ncbi:ABC transporter substrate-binding protein [Actinopolymorpha pittospori]
MLTTALLASTASLTGCDLLSTDPSGDGKQNPSGGGHQNPGPGTERQAPGLADMVRKGDLPPLAERLPKNPLVVTPVERTGTYGGTLNAVIQSPQDGWMNATAGYDQILRWDPTFTKTFPDIAESYDIDESGKEHRFHLREGMRWSDGHPFTADDLLFAYNDVLLNEELYPAAPAYLAPTGAPAKIRKIDNHTVAFTFDLPNGIFPMWLASSEGLSLVTLPRHYLSRFHPKFNADAEDSARQQGFSQWSQLLLAKTDRWGNPDLPTLSAWKPAAASTSRIVLERNPYYWKVDTDGNQLPYIDRIAYHLMSDPQVILLKVSNGEIDFDMWRVGTPAFKPVLASKREQGRFHFFDCNWSFNNNMNIAFNLCHKDPALRAVFQNKDFRVGMSYAIDRKEIITGVLQRQGRPWQAAPRPESVFYDEEFATQYTEHDLAKANEHLDRAGLGQRDGNGFRLRPDGRRLFFSVMVPSTNGDPTFAPTMDLVRGYWRAVGVDVNIQSLDITLYTSRTNGNDFDAQVYQGDGGLNAMLIPQWYLPTGAGSRFAVPWGEWYESRGRAGERPPARVREQLALYDEAQQTVDLKEQKRLFMEVLRISKEQFYAIGTSLAPRTFGVATDRLHNVPKNIVRLYPNPGATNLPQFFIED